MKEQIQEEIPIWRARTSRMSENIDPCNSVYIFSNTKKKVRIYCLDILNTVVTGSVFSICLTAKMARLKQAKDEAAKEIAEYRAQVEKDFQKKLEEVMFLYFSVTSW